MAKKAEEDRLEGGGAVSRVLSLPEQEKRHPWFGELRSSYRYEVAICFVLYGNVHDYVIPGRKLPEYLCDAHADRLIVEYDIASGVTFPVVGHEVIARQMVSGVSKPEPRNALERFESSGQSVEVGIPKDPSGALAWIENLMRVSARDGAAESRNKKVLVLIKSAHMLFPDGNIATMSNNDKAALLTVIKWGTDPELATRRAPVIIMLADAMQSLHSELRKSSSKYEFINVNLPDREARAEMFDGMAELTGLKLEDDYDRNQFVNSVSELNLIGMEDIFLSSKRAGMITRGHTLKRKKAIVQQEYGGLLETYDNPLTFADLFGCEYVKPFLMKYVVGPLQVGDARLASAGVLMIGPPGTGKSHIARCVAGAAGVNFYIFNMGAIASMWQGEGEKRAQRALSAVSDYGGILFIDEINKQLGGGGSLGSNKQDARIEGILMEWLADPARLGKVCVLAATNRPEEIKPELKRPGRFDHMLGVFPGDADDRIQFLSMSMRRRFDMEVEFDRDLASSLTGRPSRLGINLGWTNAELGSAVTKAYHIFVDTKISPGDALISALKKLKPSTQEVEEMTCAALRNINDADLLPKYLARFVGSDEVAQEEKRPAYSRGGGRE